MAATRTVGERIVGDLGELVREWTGNAWTMVCDTDDVAMVGRDVRGHLCCAVCGALAPDAARRS